MATNRVQQAIDEYSRVVKQAALDYEDALRKAELDLRKAMSSSEPPEPPVEDTVTMSKSDYDKLQKYLDEISKKHPEVNR